jgi:hypothetical protein
MLNLAVVVLLIRPRPVLVGAVDHNTQGFPYFHPPGVRFAIIRYIGRVFKGFLTNLSTSVYESISCLFLTLCLNVWAVYA